MQKSPLTDRDIGLIVGGFDEVKFADIRHKALKEYVNIKKKRKKDKTTPIPEAWPGKQVVATQMSYKSRNYYYYLYEIVDFELYNNVEFKYFGILIKTTDKKALNRIGRLSVLDSEFLHWSWNLKISKNNPEDIKWLEETDAQIFEASSRRS